MHSPKGHQCPEILKQRLIYSARKKIAKGRLMVSRIPPQVIHSLVVISNPDISLLASQESRLVVSEIAKAANARR